VLCPTRPEIQNPAAHRHPRRNVGNSYVVSSHQSTKVCGVSEPQGNPPVLACKKGWCRFPAIDLGDKECRSG